MKLVPLLIFHIFSNFGKRELPNDVHTLLTVTSIPPFVCYSRAATVFVCCLRSEVTSTLARDCVSSLRLVFEVWTDLQMSFKNHSVWVDFCTNKWSPSHWRMVKITHIGRWILASCVSAPNVDLVHFWRPFSVNHWKWFVQTVKSPKVITADDEWSK